MSAHAWHARRSKGGLGARQYAQVLRKVERLIRRGHPLPVSATSKGHQLNVTLTIGEQLDDNDDLE